MIVTVTLCYNNYGVLEESISKYYELCYQKPDIHFLVDNEYPLHKTRNKETLDKLSKKFGCIVLTPGKNLGMKEGTIWSLNQLSLQDNDKIIFYDSNSFPTILHFDKALVSILDNEIFGASCLTKKNIDLEIKTDKYTNQSYYLDADIDKNYYFNSSVGCFPFYIHKQLKFNIDFFSKNYGDLVNMPSSTIKTLLKRMNKKIAYLSDYHENLFYFKDNKKEDEIYSHFKLLTMSKRNINDFSLEQFIQNRDLYLKMSPINYKIKKAMGV